MKTIERHWTETLYFFEELSPEAQEHAIQKYRESRYDWYWLDVDFLIDAIKDIAKKWNAKYNYEFDTCHPSFVKFTMSDFEDELEGKRAIAYIYNNFIKPFMEPEYRYKRTVSGKSISKKSGVKQVLNISDTCLDNVIMKSFKEFCEEVRKYYRDTYAFEFLTICGDNIAHCIVKEAESLDSDEYIREYLISEDEWGERYNKDGDIV